MSRAALLRRAPARIMRLPPSSDPSRDPLGPGQQSPLPYREARELLRCIEIMGPENSKLCDDAVFNNPDLQANIPPSATLAPLPLKTETARGISSPVPVGAQALKGGSRRATVGDVEVTILPDQRSADKGMTGRAETHIAYSWSGLGYNTNAQGNVTRFTPPSIKATISTTYGPNVTAASTSGYGRGTTATDKAAGTTSLGFHEGRHGLDFLTSLHLSSTPTFTGFVDQAEADFITAKATFGTDVATYFAKIESDSQLSTDCVGVTIDQHNAQQGTITNICPAPPAPAAAPAPGGTP